MIVCPEIKQEQTQDHKTYFETVSLPVVLAATFDSQLPSPKLSLQMPPKVPLPQKSGNLKLSSFNIAPALRAILHGN